MPKVMRITAEYEERGAWTGVAENGHIVVDELLGGFEGYLVDQCGCLFYVAGFIIEDCYEYGVPGIAFFKFSRDEFWVPQRCVCYDLSKGGSWSTFSGHGGFDDGGNYDVGFAGRGKIRVSIEDDEADVEEKIKDLREGVQLLEVNCRLLDRIDTYLGMLHCAE